MPYLFVESLAIQAPQAFGEAEGTPTRVLLGSVRAMARAAMRRLTVAAALAALLAGGVAGLARPPSQGVALAAVETEGVGADLNRALPAFGGSAPVELPPIGNPLWAIPSCSKLSATRDRPLFSASRRPPTPPAAPAAPEPDRGRRRCPRRRRPPSPWLAPSSATTVESRSSTTNRRRPPRAFGWASAPQDGPCAPSNHVRRRSRGAAGW